jgi:Phosphoesterase family
MSQVVQALGSSPLWRSTPLILTCDEHGGYFDHTSILAFLERRWNLPALTYRDANANDLTEFLDLGALAAGQPTFPELPPLAAPGDTAAALACLSTGPGTIPRASAAPLPAPPVRLEINRVRVNRPLRGLVVELETNRGSLSEIVVELRHGSTGWRVHGWRACQRGRSGSCSVFPTGFRQRAATR